MDRLFEELEVECGASVQCITERVSALLMLDIEVEVLTEEEWNAVPQFVLVEGDRARIPVRGSDPRWYRLHVVIHELAHLLCGHSRCEALPMAFERLRKPAQACVLAGVGAGGGSAASDVCQEQADQEAEAEALAHRLGAYVLVPQLASADAVWS
ncbi:hypothetical protein [Microbacterium sp. MYb62]|uniref:hypothetical protein n=1 Tax=Microbacterium sp. MYb62 TaxID=1848690 RepID=UPI000CFB4A7A|nr:hypothetical protein [Microbacterium sp. MYb62]PRB18402.1 hypothetical protein CQ042_03700 [Microbacterium sp. MYb62]